MNDPKSSTVAQGFMSKTKTLLTCTYQRADSRKQTNDRRSDGSPNPTNPKSEASKRLSRQLSDLSQMGKDLSLLKRMSKQTRLQMQNLRHQTAQGPRPRAVPVDKEEDGESTMG